MNSSALFSLYGNHSLLLFPRRIVERSLLAARRSIRLRSVAFSQQLRTAQSHSEPPVTTSNPAYEFARRHLGPNERQTKEMLQVLGLASLDELVQKTVPSDIQFRGTMKIPDALRK